MKKAIIYITTEHHKRLRTLAKQDNRPLGAQVETLIDQERIRRQAEAGRGSEDSGAAELVA